MNIAKKNALTFVVILGFVSLFADITYEGARSLSGQYLAILGASGTVVGIVAGFGEFIGYGFRLLSGYFTDKTGRYWSITIVGYFINLLAVPLLALAGNWPLAATLIIMERFGKAIRSPAKDAMLSYASKAIGRGFGFGLHEAMDQIGAILGPLMVSGILYYQGSYQASFAFLGIPAFCALSILFIAKKKFPEPRKLEIAHTSLSATDLSFPYWMYICAICFVAAGYVDFALIAYHFEKTQTVQTAWIPIFFCVAMAADGLSALFFGRLYDKWGIAILIFSTFLSSLFVLLVFTGSFYLSLFGIILWGIGLGSQESVMRAVVANMVPPDKRGTAYGTLNFWFGSFWFLGSAVMGGLYDMSILYLVIFSFVCQMIALPILFTLLYNKRET